MSATVYPRATGSRWNCPTRSPNMAPRSTPRLSSSSSSWREISNAWGELGTFERYQGFAEGVCSGASIYGGSVVVWTREEIEDVELCKVEGIAEDLRTEVLRRMDAREGYDA